MGFVVQNKQALYAAVFVARCTISALGGYLLALAIGLTFPLWASISAIVVSQEQLAETRTSVIRRILGTACGVLCAVTVNLAATRMNINVSGQLGLSVSICAAIAYKYPAFRTGMWTCPIVLLTAAPSESIAMVGLYRGSEVILGGLLGGGIHYIADRVISMITFIRVYSIQSMDPGEAGDE